MIGKGPRGSEAIKLTRETCEVTVRGNWDTFIARDAVQPFEGGQARDELTDDDVHWLAALPNTHELVMSGKRIRLLHASQTSEFVRVRVQHTRDEFLGMFSNTPFTGEFRAGDGRRARHRTSSVTATSTAPTSQPTTASLFNAGAVGNHLDAPSAPYVILEGIVGSVVPESLRPRALRHRGRGRGGQDLRMPDVDAYALELREGTYRGNGIPSA